MWKEYLVRIVEGFCIGAGAILPGVSGGVLAVAMGLYESMVSALTKLFSAFRKNFLFLLPIAVGGVIGVLTASNLLKTYFAQYETQITMLFCGFVLGNLPWLFLEAKGEARFKKRYLLALCLGFLFILGLAYGEALISQNETVSFLTDAKALLVGAVLSVGIIIPGVSASFLLLYMGLYAALLSAIAEVRLGTLFFVGLGFLATSALLLLTVNQLLKKHHAVSYFAIIGFSTGSVLIVMPKIVPGLTWICPILFILGLSASVALGYLKAKKIGITAELPQDSTAPPDASAATGAREEKQGL